MRFRRLFFQTRSSSLIFRSFILVLQLTIPSKLFYNPLKCSFFHYIGFRIGLDVHSFKNNYFYTVFFVIALRKDFQNGGEVWSWARDHYVMWKTLYWQGYHGDVLLRLKSGLNSRSSDHTHFKSSSCVKKTNRNGNSTSILELRTTFQLKMWTIGEMAFKKIK